MNLMLQGAQGAMAPIEVEEIKGKMRLLLQESVSTGPQQRALDGCIGLRGTYMSHNFHILHHIATFAGEPPFPNYGNRHYHPYNRSFTGPANSSTIALHL